MQEPDFENDGGQFEVDALCNRQPMKITENRVDVIKPPLPGHNPGQHVLYFLQFAQILGGDSMKDAVTVIKFLTDDRTGNRFDSLWTQGLLHMS